MDLSENRVYRYTLKIAFLFIDDDKPLDSEVSFRQSQRAKDRACATRDPRDPRDPHAARASTVVCHRAAVASEWTSVGGFSA